MPDIDLDGLAAAPERVTFGVRVIPAAVSLADPDRIERLLEKAGSLQRRPDRRRYFFDQTDLSF